MKTLALLFFTLFFLNLSAQTKWIAHKSHSGSKSNFINSLKGNPSNFGMAPQRFVRNANLDSVILINQRVAVMVTSETCHYEDFNGRDKSNSQLWRAGRDTVFDHELFNGNKSVSEIRHTLKTKYFFSNPAEKVVLIGFEKPEQLKDKEEKNNDPQNQVSTNIPHQKKIKKRDTSDEQDAIPNDHPKNPSMLTMIFISLVSLFTRGTFSPF